MFPNKSWMAMAALAALLIQNPAQAAFITDASAITGPRNVITFDGYDGLSTYGPVNVGAEVGDTVIFTSTPFAELGAYERDLGQNGLWGVGERFVASEFVGNAGELGFSFTRGVSAVGAFMNQFQRTTGALGPLTLIAYDIDGNTLETHTFAIDTDAYGYNEGRFLGIQRTAGDIYGFGVADGSFVLDNLTYTAPVPEPATVALMVAGLGVVGLTRRRNRKA
jgi:hypothetical protein